MNNYFFQVSANKNVKRALFTESNALDNNENSRTEKKENASDQASTSRTSCNLSAASNENENNQIINDNNGNTVVEVENNNKPAVCGKDVSSNCKGNFNNKDERNVGEQSNGSEEKHGEEITTVQNDIGEKCIKINGKIAEDNDMKLENIDGKDITATVKTPEIQVADIISGKSCPTNGGKSTKNSAAAKKSQVAKAVKTIKPRPKGVPGPHLGIRLPKYESLR